MKKQEEGNDLIDQEGNDEDDKMGEQLQDLPKNVLKKRVVGIRRKIHMKSSYKSLNHICTPSKISQNNSKGAGSFDTIVSGIANLSVDKKNHTREVGEQGGDSDEEKDPFKRLVNYFRSLGYKGQKAVAQAKAKEARDQANLARTLELKRLKLELEKIRLESAAPVEETFRIHQILLTPDLQHYVDTGNRLKNDMDSGAANIEAGISNFVDAVKEYGSRGAISVFSYLDGSSGLGKTQLAFALHRKVLYIPLGDSQRIYLCFQSLHWAVKSALQRDLTAMRNERFHSKDVGLFSAAHIESALAPKGHMKFYTVSLLIKLLEICCTNVSENTNVFLGANCSITIPPMTVMEGREALKGSANYREVLIHIDEVPEKDDFNMTDYDQCLLLRNMARCLALPCLLSGTESTLLDVVNNARGSRSEGRVSWAWLLTKFPANRLLGVQTPGLSDYELHLQEGARPLFIHWFAEAVAAAPASGEGNLRMTPDTLSRMKDRICAAKLKKLPNGRHYDIPWLHASTLLVFADSLEGSGEVSSSASSRPPETSNKRKVGGLSDDVMHHSQLIRKHFALLHVPRELVDSHGMLQLFLEDKDLHDMYHKTFLVKAAFRSCAEDPLLYLACLRDGLVQRIAGVSNLVQVPSSHSLLSFRAQSGVGNRDAKSNDGTALETECMAAFVLAAHRYTSFAGTEFFRWLALVIAELSEQVRFEETQISIIPEELRAALKEVMVPLLSPPNCPWGEESMHSSINFGNLTWCKNKAQRDGSVSLGTVKAADNVHEIEERINNEDKATGDFLFGQVNGYTSLCAECKDGRGFGGKEMVAVVKKVADGSVTLLVGSDPSDWQPKTIAGFDQNVSVYRMNSKSSIERVSPQVAVTDWAVNRKVLIALDLEKIYPGRRSTVKR